jgi:3D (Asp-Asp-Asp) domain-containing protein
MPRHLTHSGPRKVVVLVSAVAAFVLLYETRIFDSQSAVWQAMVRDAGPPAPGSRLAFTATAYCRGTTTASGVGAVSGIAAADPAILPVGSVVNVATGDDRYSGIYTILDTGPKVQGRKLDLYMWNCDEAVRFGHKQVQVTVLRLGWSPRASAPSLIDRLFRGRQAARRVPPREPRPTGVPPPSEAEVQPAETPGSPPAASEP